MDQENVVGVSKETLGQGGETWSEKKLDWIKQDEYEHLAEELGEQRGLT